MKIQLFVVLCSLMAVMTSFAELHSHEVEYREGETVMKGYLAWSDEVDGPRPGILVVHEWWGHNAYARKRADMLAELGYAALAVDMYGGGRLVDHPADAGKFAGELSKNVDVAEARFKAAMDFLQSQKQVAPDHISAIGYCFGGGIVLHMARSGVDLDAVVSFHGSLGPLMEAKPGSVKAKVLICTGGDDPFVPAEQIEGFRKEMDALKADYEVMILEGAQHSFTNPDADSFGKRFELPLKYDAEADRRSWEGMQELLKSCYP